MTTAPDHLDVAAYVLGILDAEEVDAFENHLTECRRCALDLRDFAVVPDLIDEADAGGMLRGTAPERPDGKSVRVMLDQVAARRRRRRWFVAQGVAAAAAGIIAVTAVVTTLVVRGDNDSANTAQPGSTTSSTETSQTRVANNSTDESKKVSGNNQATGVTASIEATDEPWGTSIKLEISGMAAPAKGSLVAVSRTGRVAQIASFFAPETVAGEKKAFHPIGSVAMRWHDIAVFRVADDNGKVLVEVLAS
ncbi:zf-HC2 domain-containing protein [Lentzea tibetensis]|uniref:Zf-HC2 domain-containing protein n=1 Tax=Lentzea tibetensis TaxID=2591470 RepID=A0A563EGN9_9PSEU|nr:zf-HC2 domain-containing protein [Lentzea tibetensis]TWP45611.1 zf-HC2 domain-containing protein [Lentzea tibetensis]